MNIDIKKAATAVTLLIGLTGCQSGMNGITPLASLTGNNGSSSAQEAPLDIGVDFNKVDQEISDAEQAMLDAQAELDKLIDKNGNFKYDLTSSATTNGLTPISGKLDEAFDKIILAVGKVRTVVTDARSKITDQIAKLDANNPAQAALIDKMNLILEKYDTLTGKLDTVLGLVVEKVDYVLGKASTFKANLNWTNPLHIAAYFVIEEIESSIVRFRDLLANA